MSLELKPGLTLPIPCRNCGKITKVAFRPGKSEMSCINCRRTTEISIQQEASGWKVKTELRQTPANP